MAPELLFPCTMKMALTLISSLSSPFFSYHGIILHIVFLPETKVAVSGGASHGASGCTAHLHMMCLSSFSKTKAVSSDNRCSQGKVNINLMKATKIPDTSSNFLFKCTFLHLMHKSSPTSLLGLLSKVH